MSILLQARASIRDRWRHYFESGDDKEPGLETAPTTSHSTARIFGVPLEQSLRHAKAMVPLNAHGDACTWGYVPVIVAKCGLYLRENATEVEGVFSIICSTKRLQELQAVFEAPPNYGRDVKMEVSFTVHEAAGVLCRYLAQLPESILSRDLTNDFRRILSNEHLVVEKAIKTYEQLIYSMPLPNQALLLYVLDVFSVVVRNSPKNQASVANLTGIFRSGFLYGESRILSFESPQDERLLEFLIVHQDRLARSTPPKTAVGDKKKLPRTNGSPPVRWEANPAGSKVARKEAEMPLNSSQEDRRVKQNELVLPAPVILILDHDVSEEPPPTVSRWQPGCKLPSDSQLRIIAHTMHTLRQVFKK